MARLSYDLYDHATFGTSADTNHALFQNLEGSANGKDTQITNMPGNGELPGGSNFEIHQIGVFTPDAMNDADIALVWDESYLELLVQNQRVFIAPLLLLAANSAYNGVLAQAAAADVTAVGPVGMGRMFDPVIQVNAGVQLRVNVFQDKALNTASLVGVFLRGIFDRPDQR